MAGCGFRRTLRQTVAGSELGGGCTKWGQVFLGTGVKRNGEKSDGDQGRLACRFFVCFLSGDGMGLRFLAHITRQKEKVTSERIRRTLVEQILGSRICLVGWVGACGTATYLSFWFVPFKTGQ